MATNVVVPTSSKAESNARRAALSSHAGADAVATVENKGRDLIAQADAYRDVSSSLAHDD